MKERLLLFLFLFFGSLLYGQQPDSSGARIDSVVPAHVPTINIHQIIAENRFLQSAGKPEVLPYRLHTPVTDNDLFYLLAAILLFFGILKTVYAKYFTNMFRVFFNSSLRQSQLTDQLMQDGLAGLLLNIFFVIVAGLYAYLVFRLRGFIPREISWSLIGICIAGVAAIYLVKYMALRFTGWITGYTQEANMYIFIIFLINKIIAICLVPVLVVLAFSDNLVVRTATVLSVILIAGMLIVRILRAYGLLQHRIRVSRFHFLLYIFSLEVLPLLLIYKAIMIFFRLNM